MRNLPPPIFWLLAGLLLWNSAAQAGPRSPPAALPCLATAPEGMACIPGGPFVRGSDGGPWSSRPQAAVWVQTFYIDRHEVTVARYQACVAAGKCRRARTVYSDYSRPRQPKVGVSWHHAVRFCRAMGQRLPTEAQWEKAARGTDGRRFPWGDQPATCQRAVIKDPKLGRSCGVRKQGKAPHKGRTLVVGSRPPNQYGLYDMAGNAWEWVHDWYSAGYARCGRACRGPDPRGPCRGRAPCRGRDMRVVRGGSWYWPGKMAATYYRRAHFPANKPYHHYGFRCAASVAQAEKIKNREQRTESRE